MTAQDRSTLAEWPSAGAPALCSARGLWAVGSAMAVPIVTKIPCNWR